MYILHLALKSKKKTKQDSKQEGLAVASITRDDPSTLPSDDPFPHARARMHRDRTALGLKVANKEPRHPIF